jgi:hypothetical protein
VSFSYNKVLDNSAAIVRTHLTLLLAIAGVFSFLPNLLLNHFLPIPAMTGTDPQAVLGAMSEYAAANWYWYLLGLLFGMAGTLAMSSLILDTRQPTVRTAIGEGLVLLPSYAVTAFLLAMAGSILFLLLVVLLALPLGQSPLVALLAMIPFLYLFGRLAIVAQVIVAEDRRGPFNALSRTLALTRGKGWSIAGLAVAAFLLMGMAVLVARAVVGIPLRLLLEAELAEFLEQIVTGAVAMVLEVLVIALYAGIYRSLIGDRSGATVFD